MTTKLRKYVHRELPPALRDIGLSDVPFKDVDAKAHRAKPGRDGRILWVENLPGHGGVSWGYGCSSDKAIVLSPYWQRRFATEMDVLSDNAVFLAERSAPSLPPGTERG